MADNPEMASSPSNGESGYRRSQDLATALARLQAAIGGKEFFVRVRWPQTDLTATAVRLLFDLPTIDIHLGPETSDGYRQGTLELRIPTPAIGNQDLPSDFDDIPGTTWQDSGPETEWWEFEDRGQLGLKLEYLLSAFDPSAMQEISIATGAGLLELMIGGLPSRRIQ